MADRYVRSTDGSDADDGTTWALAKATLTGVAAIDTAGDRIFVSDAHAESTAGAVSVALAGTIADPTKVICGDDIAEPPTATATTGSVSTTGGSAITVSGVHYYIYGVIFNPSSDASASSASFTNNSTGWSEYENCSVLLTGTNSGNVVTVCGSTDGGARWRNCTYRFANAGQGISSAARVMAEIEGGSILSGGTAPSTSLFKPGSPSVWKVSGMDLTNGATAMNLTATTGVGIKFYIRNCKLPASWSGSLNSSAPGSNSEYEMHNCDSGDTNYRYWRKTQYGEAVSETTIIKTGGASDGTTGLSWKLTSNASAEFPHAYFKSGEIVKWNETTGSAITVTVDVIHSGVGGGGSGDFTDKELWLEVEYFGTSGFPLGSPINDRAADILGAAADQDNSSATWTSEPATPVKQKLNVTFTPQEKGYIYAKVCLAVASKTVYVDFEPVVT